MMSGGKGTWNSKDLIDYYLENKSAFFFVVRSFDLRLSFYGVGLST